VTAANQSVTGPVATRRGGGSALAHPRVQAMAALWGAVILNLIIIEVLFFATDPAKNALHAAGKFLGLHAALAMLLQLVLIARLPWLDRRLGMDRLTSWHRWTGFSLFWLVLLHPTFVMLGYAQAYNSTFLEQASNLIGMGPTMIGFIAVGIIAVAAGVSVRLGRRKLSYEIWHAVHVLLYVSIVLALIHQMYEASTFTATTVSAVYWWSLWAFAGLSLIIGRIVMPLRRNAGMQLRVAAVVAEAGNVVSVHMTGKDLDKLGARAGQFFIWRFVGYNSWWKANPFSLSAAPGHNALRLTAKAVGETSAGLRNVPVGTRVFAEGPYGAFTSFHKTREGTVLIAGGVGVTPIRALLEELSGPIAVLYRVQSPADAVLLAEMEQLARMKGGRVHVLSGRTGAGNPPNVPFAPENLVRLVPDILERDVFVCGPPAMTDAVLKSLRQLKVPPLQIHAERFALAS
jgi:predicted ferric reductase